MGSNRNGVLKVGALLLNVLAVVAFFLPFVSIYFVGSYSLFQLQGYLRDLGNYDSDFGLIATVMLLAMLLCIGLMILTAVLHLMDKKHNGWSAALMLVLVYAIFLLFASEAFGTSIIDSITVWPWICLVGMILSCVLWSLYWRSGAPAAVPAYSPYAYGGAPAYGAAPTAYPPVSNAPLYAPAPVIPVWTCSQCGTANGDTRFCTGCGAARPAEKVCGQCGAKVTGRFCTVCGAPTDAPAPQAPAKEEPQRCTGCGRDVTGMTFCPDCGTRNERA